MCMTEPRIFYPHVTIDLTNDKGPVDTGLVFRYEESPLEEYLAGRVAANNGKLTVPDCVFIHLSAQSGRKAGAHCTRRIHTTEGRISYHRIAQFYHPGDGAADADRTEIGEVLDALRHPDRAGYELWIEARNPRARNLGFSLGNGTVKIPYNTTQDDLRVIHAHFSMPDSIVLPEPHTTERNAVDFLLACLRFPR